MARRVQKITKIVFFDRKFNLENWHMIFRAIKKASKKLSKLSFVSRPKPFSNRDWAYQVIMVSLQQPVVLI